MKDAAADACDVNKLDAAYEAVRASCALHGIGVTRLESLGARWLGVELIGATRTWSVDVDCAEESLLLPAVWLRQPMSLLAHVSYKGKVCIDDGQGLSIDPDRPAEVVAHSIIKAYDLLERSATDAAAGQVEFFNELEGYWLWLPDSLRSRAYFDVDGVSRSLKGYVNRKTKPAQWFFTEQDAEVPWEVSDEKLESQRALYVHLDGIAAPPIQPNKITATFIADVLRRMSPEQLQMWGKLLGPSKNGPKQLALMVSVPRQAGGRSLVGIVFRAHRGEVDVKTPVTPLTMRRHHASYMRERGGATLDLLGKHVAVLGAGAVGSVVIDTLAAAGIGKLTVVDHDEYSEDNVFRHVLNPLYIDLNKAAGLRLQMQRRYPGLKVKSECKTAQTWLKTADLKEYDGIVVAFGAPSVERSFSRAFKARRPELPIIFTWLEALDLGGHSVLTWGRGEGCLECLYRDDEGQPSLASRNSFLEPNQPVTRNLTGCGGAFVPFGALHARRTGLMAAEQMLASIAVASSEQKPAYDFWVGEGQLAVEQGLRTTPWFQAARTTSKADASRQVFGRPCKHCRQSDEPV